MTKGKKLTAAFAAVFVTGAAGYGAFEYYSTENAVRDRLERHFVTYMPDRSQHPFFKCLVDEAAPGIAQKEIAKRYDGLRQYAIDEGVKIQNRYSGTISKYGTMVVTPPASLIQTPPPPPPPTWRERMRDMLNVPMNAFNDASRATRQNVNKIAEPYHDVLQHSGTCTDRHGPPITPRDVVTLILML